MSPLTELGPQTLDFGLWTLDLLVILGRKIPELRRIPVDCLALGRQIGELETLTRLRLEAGACQLCLPFVYLWSASSASPCPASLHRVERVNGVLASRWPCSRCRQSPHNMIRG